MHSVPPEHRSLVEQLARLDHGRRRAIVAAAERAARARPVTVSRATLDELTSIVAIGGDAVEDCDRLYDE